MTLEKYKIRRNGIIVSFFVLFFLASACWADVGVEYIDCKAIKRHLPYGWIIKYVKAVEAPCDWRRTAGGMGVMVCVENPGIDKSDPRGGNYHPSYSFTLVPTDWEGEDETNDLFFSKGKLSLRETKGKIITMKQIYPDIFKKKYPDFYYFGASVFKSGMWENPSKVFWHIFDEEANKAVRSVQHVFKSLKDTVRNHFPKAEISVTDKLFEASSGTMMFTLHPKNRMGKIYEKTVQKRGPDSHGFILSVSVQKGEYQGSVMVPQTLRRTYWQTYFDCPMTPDKNNHYVINFSYGCRLDKKFKYDIFKVILPETSESRCNRVLR